MNLRALRPRHALVAALALLVCAMLSFTAYTLWRLHAIAISNGLEISEMHTRSIEDFLTQSLRVTELSSPQLVPQEIGAHDLRRIETNLINMLRHAPYLRSISLLDRNGRIVTSTNRANIGVLVNSSSYLPPATPDQEILRIGQPWSGRDFSDGRMSTPEMPVDSEALNFIPVTRTLMLGKTNATLLFALNPDYFINHILLTLPVDIGSVEVMRYDGLLLMDTNIKARVGTLLTKEVRDLRLPEVESGRFQQDLGHGQGELTAYRASRLYPFVVLTHIDRTHALQKWQTEAKTLLAVVIPVLLAISLLAAAFYRRLLQNESQRREAERIQRINATVFDSSAEAIIITDLNANIISVNAAFSHITGYSPEEVLGKNPRILSSGQQSRDFYKELWEVLLRDNFWQGELLNRHKNGSLYNIHLSISASRDRTTAAFHRCDYRYHRAQAA
jgi:PAS domain S-box-containing protein